MAGGFFTSWATREAQEYWNGGPIPSPADLPDPGIEPRSPALQVDSLPDEPHGKPVLLKYFQKLKRRNSLKENFTKKISVEDTKSVGHVF